MARPTIVILDDWQHALSTRPEIARLRERADVRVYDDHADSADELARRLDGAVAVMLIRERTKFSAETFARAPSLRLIVQTGGGGAHLDRAAAEAHGVQVVFTGGPDYPVVELTIGLLIGLLRRIPWSDRQLRAGEWPMFVGEDCHGKTLGILGFGRIGSGTARVAQALGMRVVAWGPTLTAERAQTGGATFLPLDDVLRTADVVSIHLRLSPESTGLLSRERLALLRPTAYLINTARGAIVDEAALVEMLQRGRLAGAALDVFQEEPLPADHPLRRLDNVILTPHVGWPAASNYAHWGRRGVEQALAFLDEAGL
ncbi:MAG TPA: D-2-hydroxyacid dehydrogenase family protein [Chloroflexota bacterium]|nr:D-2-hydroxyacid dehydrogenase family protein [Chloroflexota bacterium]